MKRWLPLFAFAGTVACGAFPSGGRKGGDKPAPPPAPAPAAPASDFMTDVNPVLVQYCGVCHDPHGGKTKALFLGDESAFRANADDVVRRINATDRKVVMPPPYAHDPVDDEAKAKIMKFLGK